VSDVVEHPQAVERGNVLEYEVPDVGEVIVRGFPLHFSESETAFERGPPGLGEHTDEILGRVGVSSEERERLREKGAVE
jgi:crotonobetainyl-CoA:carnitine CoA-transferase CaiB-like acyl-CoA transferase